MRRDYMAVKEVNMSDFIVKIEEILHVLHLVSLLFSFSYFSFFNEKFQEQFSSDILLSKEFLVKDKS